MSRHRAVGSDGMPIEFYQSFWHLVCNDLFKLFQDFYDGIVDISSLSDGVVTLVAKGQGSYRIHIYIYLFACLTFPLRLLLKFLIVEPC